MCLNDLPEEDTDRLYRKAILQSLQKKMLFVQKINI